MKKFYITTAIDYVNAYPHHGHAYQKVIADILSRWHKLKEEDIFFLTGTDEHGQKISKAAKDLKEEPKKFVDEMSKKFKDSWRILNIDYNRFIRTTDKDHKEFVQEFVKKIKNDLYKGKYEGYYCLNCEAYKTEKELINGECLYHPGKKVGKIKEETYFFKLSKYQNKLLKLYKENPEFVLPKERRNEIVNFVKDGLQDLSITRTNFEWGIPFPLDKNHVVYVWFEALLNYLTGAGKNQEFWPADIHLLGKDNGRFHAVIWPAMLMSAGYKLPKTVFIHGFLTVNGQKISKSLGNVISPKYLADKYSVDAVRYFLIREIPFGQDGDFSEEALKNRLNNELAADLGNLLNRFTTLVEKNKVKIEGKIELEKYLDVKKIDILMENLEVTEALNEIWKFVKACNKYISEKEPWNLKGNELGNVFYNLAESLRIIAILINPFMPGTSENINKQLGTKQGLLKDCKFKKFNGKIKKGKLLFKKLL